MFLKSYPLLMIVWYSTISFSVLICFSLVAIAVYLYLQDTFQYVLQKTNLKRRSKLSLSTTSIAPFNEGRVASILDSVDARPGLE